MQNAKKNMETHLKEMCLKFPTYHAASVGERDRANYIEKKFLEYGLKVRREEYKVRGWDFKSFRFVDVTAGKEVPNAICEYFSCSVDYEGKLLVVTPEQVPEIDKMNVKGRVVFLTSPLGTFEHGYFAVKLEELGAVGLIVAHFGYAHGEPHTKVIRCPYIDHIATCAVGAVGSLYIATHIDHVYRLVVDASCYDTVTDNVVGYVEGDDTKMVFGAHYDSAPFAHGAGDDASGTAMLIEMARLLKDKGNGHTLEFVAFSAEEYCDNPPPRGAKGSNEYNKLHAGENIAWYMNFDDYSATPIYSSGSLCVGHKEKLPEIDWPMPTEKECLAGDDVTFFDRGYPVVWLCQKREIPVLHSIYDCLDLIDYNAMEYCANVMYDVATKLLEKS